MIRIVALLTFAAFLAGGSALLRAAELPGSFREIDLANVLELAGARSLDVQLAQEKLHEAEARLDGVVWQSFPWLSVGAGYKRHDNRIQNVEGAILDVDKQSLAAGGTVTAQLDLGEAISRRLAEKHRREAARLGVCVASSQALRDAAVAFFDLAKAAGAVDALSESVRVSEAYEGELGHAVEVGVAYKGDELRVRVQSERYRMALRQAREKSEVAGAALVQILHLDAGTRLKPPPKPLAPLNVVDSKAALPALLEEAERARPEISQMAAFIAAADQERKAARYAPLVPSLTAQEFFGALGGGKGSELDRFASSSDSFLGLSWKIGPGGLFDASRVRQAEARQNISELERAKLVDRLAAEVTTLHARARSLSDQTGMAQVNLRTSAETLAAAAQRRETGVGMVLEVVQSQQDLTQARLTYVEIVTEQNKVQYELLHALGRLGALATEEPTDRQTQREPSTRNDRSPCSGFPRATRERSIGP